jgi:hypothetical protein
VPSGDEVRRANFGVPVDARRDLIEADFALRRDTDVDKGDDAFVTQAIPVDDSLVAANHPLPLELADQSEDLIFSDAGQLGDARRVATSVRNKRRQYAADNRIPAVEAPLLPLTIRIELNQVKSPSRPLQSMRHTRVYAGRVRRFSPSRRLLPTSDSRLLDSVTSTASRPGTTPADPRP